jgi:hypothetical protein
MPTAATINGGSGQTFYQLGIVNGTYTGSAPTSAILTDANEHTHQLNNLVASNGFWTATVAADELLGSWTLGLSNNVDGAVAGTLTVAATPDIRERIIVNVVATLWRVSSALGYVNTVTSVVRPNPGVGALMQDRQIVVWMGKPQQAPDDEPQTGREWLLPVCMLISVVESETSSVPIDARINSICADVEKELMVDINRGGLAINTFIADPDPSDIDANAHDGLIVFIANVHYRTRWNDPYTQQ